MLGPFATTSRLTPIQQMSLTVLSRAACASMSTTTTTTRDRGDRYGPMEWAQLFRAILFVYYYYSVVGRGAEYCDERVSVCPHEHISGITCPNFTEFSANVACGRGSVFLWWRSDKLCTSGIADDVMFSRNGPHGLGDASSTYQRKLK